MSTGARGRGAAAGWWVALGAVAAFGLLAWQLLQGGAFTRVDTALSLGMVERRSAWLSQAMLLVQWLNGTVPLLLATGALAAWRGWRRDWRWCAAFGVVPTGMLLNVGLKTLFGRVRPALDDPLVQLATFSFPSGHAVAATLFYGVLCAFALDRLHAGAARALAVAGAAAAIAIVCFNRVYLGAHYLSDVLAGICVGAAWLCAWLAGTRRLSR